MLVSQSAGWVVCLSVALVRLFTNSQSIRSFNFPSSIYLPGEFEINEFELATVHVCTVETCCSKTVFTITIQILARSLANFCRQ